MEIDCVWYAAAYGGFVPDVGLKLLVMLSGDAAAVADVRVRLVR